MINSILQIVATFISKAFILYANLGSAAMQILNKEIARCVYRQSEAILCIAMYVTMISFRKLLYYAPWPFLKYCMLHSSFLIHAILSRTGTPWFKKEEK